MRSGFARRPAAAPVMASGLEPQDYGLMGAAVLVAAGVVWLQAGLLSGQRGLGTLLSEKKQAFAANKPSPPDWWPEWLRLPDLDYVEVYGQTPTKQPMAPEELERSRALLEQLFEQTATERPED
jgi:cell division septation protein DedD